MIRFEMVDKVFGAFAANVVSGTTDGGLLKHCNLFYRRARIHGVHWGVSLRRWCGALFLGQVNNPRWRWICASVSVCVGHGYNDRGGICRRSRVLSPTTDSDDSFGGSPAQYHRPDVRFYERPVLDSHSRRRRVSRAPPCPASDGALWLNERDAPILTTMTPAGRHTLRRVQLSPEVRAER